MPAQIMPETQPRSNHLAMVGVERNLVASSLGLPPDTSIVNAFMDSGSMTVYFIVESPDLPEVKEGARPPLAAPTVRMEFDWGLPGESQ